MAGQAAHYRMWLFLSDQGPGSARPAPRVLASLRAAARRSMPDSDPSRGAVSIVWSDQGARRGPLVDLPLLVEQCVRDVICCKDPPLPLSVPAAVAIEGLLNRLSLQDGF